MGGGSWDTSTYVSSRVVRSSTGVSDFAYSKEAAITKKIHETLDPRRINSKPFKKLESRDSVEHPESTPIIVCFDVTGSNFSRAIEAQKKLPNLMELLNKYINDPQIMVAANDDFEVVGGSAFQISEFESDNRVDDWIRNIWLVSNGGGNDGESYDLMLYAAARKMITDSWEVRQKKGYLFMYADEPIFAKTKKAAVQQVFGDDVESDIPIATIISEVKERWNVFLIWPEGGYIHAREQYTQLFGADSVITLQHPNLICELVASVVALNEEKLTAETARTELSTAGLNSREVDDLIKTSVKTIAARRTNIDLPATGAATSGGAARL